MLSVKFSYILSKMLHRAKIGSEIASSGCLQEVKKSGQSLTIRPKKWSPMLTGGGCLLEVPTVRL